MFKKLLSWLESGLAIGIAGVFLLADLIPHIWGEGYHFLPFEASWVTVLICGTPLVISAVKRLSFRKGLSRISSPLLISTAMIAAIAIGDLFAAGEVAFIMAIGEKLEDLTVGRAKRGLKDLLELAPRQARRVTGELIDASQVRVGDILRVLPGEAIPADGLILSGQTSIDQSVLTGESLPVDREPGDRVYCGTVNRFGSIDMEVTAVGQEQSIQKLIRMVRQAEENQAPMQRIADRWASILVPVALILAIAAGLIRQDTVTAVTVLVVFCPCALVLATPTAIMAAIGQAAKKGVVIKSGQALERLGQVDTLAFDKTGTLTYGRLAVSDVICLEEGLPLLALTAAAESRSEHPLGKAIVAKAAGLELPPAEEFRMEAGKGICATVDGKQLVCGSEKFLTEKGIGIPNDLKEKLEALRDQGKALVLTALDGQCAGAIGLSDVLRPEAAEMVKKLERNGVKTVLLTGDNRRAAAWLAGQVGISDVRAELLPEEKVAAIQSLQAEGRRVCMVGDGINDAPALKTAQVGVAMGAMGSDLAVEASDIALMGDDISKLPYLKKLGNSTAKTIKLGIFLSLFINFAAIVLSFLNLLTPTTGALVHNLGSVVVILIATGLYDRKLDK